MNVNPSGVLSDTEKIKLGNMGRFAFVMLFLSAMLVLALAFNVSVGSVSIAAHTVLNMLWDGIRCGMKSTSCPDQLAQALKTLR